MLNMNEFKEKTKDWLKDHPNSTKKEFLTFCKSLIPQEESKKYAWVIDQVGMWYENVTFNRERIRRTNSSNLAS